jgi:hypothetical protein
MVSALDAYPSCGGIQHNCHQENGDIDKRSLAKVYSPPQLTGMMFNIGLNQWLPCTMTGVSHSDVAAPCLCWAIEVARKALLLANLTNSGIQLVG